MELAWMLFAIALGVAFAWLCVSAVLALAEWLGGWVATGLVIALIVVGVLLLAVLG